MGLDEFETHYRAVLGLSEPDFTAFMTAVHTPLPSAFRVTPTAERNAIIKCLTAYSFVTSVPALPNVYTFPLRLKTPEYEAFIAQLIALTDAGYVQRQEVVSMLPHLFYRPDAVRVLETCAAPGSKTKQLLEEATPLIIPNAPQTPTEAPQNSRNEGNAAHITAGPQLLIANDKAPRRLNVLVSEASKKAAPGLVITNCNATSFPSPHSLFEHICCDVPCSSDGTVRKNPAVAEAWAPATARGLHSLQLSILSRSGALLAPGGRLVYSTCSFNPIENECVVDRFLQSGDYELCEPSEMLGASGVHIAICETPKEVAYAKARGSMVFRRGLTKFTDTQTSDAQPEEDANPADTEDIPGEGDNTSESSAKHSPKGKREASKKKRSLETQDLSFCNEDLKKCLRVFPHDQNTGGFFIAILRLKEGVERRASTAVAQASSKPVYFEAPESVTSELQKRFNIQTLPGRFVSRTASFKTLYFLSEEAFRFVTENPRLAIIHAGVKAFERTDIGDCSYRAKGSFLETVGLPADHEASIEDLRRLLVNKDVPWSELSFRAPGHFTVGVAGLPYRFSGFGGNTSAFLYIDAQHRKALLLLHGA